MIKFKIKYFILIIIFVLLLIGCGERNDKTLSDFISSFTIEENISDDIELSDSYTFNNKTITAVWSSDNEDALTSDGKVILSEDEAYVTLTGTFKYNDIEITKSFDIVVEGVEISKLISKAFSSVSLPDEANDDIELPNKVTYGSYRFSTSWVSSKPNIISNSGVFNYPDEDTAVTLTCNVSRSTNTYSKSFTVTAKKLDKAKYLNALNNLNIPSMVETNLHISSSITIDNKDYDIIWSSNNEEVLTTSGRISYVNSNTIVLLSATINVKNVAVTKVFEVTVIPNEAINHINQCIDEIVIPNIISNDIYLLKSLHNVKLEWTSSDPTVLNNDGTINKENKAYKQVTLSLKLTSGEHEATAEFITYVAYEPHMFIDRTFTGTKESTKISNGKLVLADGALKGTYTTDEISVNNFFECVGSYSAISSKTETCELKVRLKVNNKWSKYFTYGEFGFGLQNACYGQNDTYVTMSEDEIKTTSSYQATAFQLQIVLKRSKVSETGPIVSLIALTIFYNVEDFTVDITNIRKEVKYDVPELYQHIVPNIGGIICSVTSSTMLVMHKGYSFDFTTQYPHQYMAPLLKDYGNNVYGNWSYNCIGIGSLGFNSYVKKFQSYEEIMYHLNYVGPISASIRGTFKTDAKTYTTGGHLIVLTGYKIEGSKIYFYVNDPNIYGVSTRTTLENLKAVNRMVSYIVE
jgi:hypothetical protein